MNTVLPFYQQIRDRINAMTRTARVPQPSVTRLALLVTGLVAARSRVVDQIADELAALDLTAAHQAESIARRLRRTMNDAHLSAATCYEPAVREALDWPALLRGSNRVVIALDESSKRDQVHLVRFSYVYWGGSIPLVWATWEQNVPLPAGSSWRVLDELLDRLAPMLPRNVEVVLVGDRAYGIPGLLDRLRRRGWHWVLRIKTRDSHRFRDRRGQEMELREVVKRELDRPGRRWKACGELFKGVGWRAVAVVGVWAAKAKEPLVVITDLPCAWETLRIYERRFWIEPGFRSDKSKGWHWEDSQVRTVAHHDRLVLGMAWATMVMLCLGLEDAQRRLAERAARRATQPKSARPQPARLSLFSLGLRQARRWLYRTTSEPLPWQLDASEGRSWTDRWRADQACHLIFSETVRS